MSNRLKLIFLVVSIFNTSYAQLVNIESMRMHTDSVRFASKSDFSSWYSNNNGSYVFANSISSTSQFKTRNLKNIFLILGNINSIISKETKYLNSWLAHTRYNHKFNKWFGAELFFQYGGNGILDVNERMIIGAGPRFKLIARKRMNFYLGESFMLDFERNTDLSRSFYNLRNNFYISTTIDVIKSKVELINTFYWQAVYTKIGDYNVLNQLKINCPITKKFNTFILMDYFLDKITPLDRSQYYFNTKLGIGLNL